MELIRVKAYQPLACYRKPFSYGFWDTYPLPPFSTVLGWVHWVLGESDREDKLPLNIGVVGQFDTITHDLQKLKKFDRVRRNKICTNCSASYDENRKKCPECNSEEYSEKVLKEPERFLNSFNSILNETVTYVANITNIHLRIYIQMDQEHMERFRDRVLQVNYPSLGRYEDLLRIDEVEILSLEETKISKHDPLEINYSIYLKPQTAKSSGTKGSNFQLPFYHELINHIRFFEKERVVYTDSASINSGEYLIDNETDKVFHSPILVELFGKYAESANEVLR